MSGASLEHPSSGGGSDLLPELQTRPQQVLQFKAVKSLWNQLFGAPWLIDLRAPSSDMDVPHVLQAGHPSPTQPCTEMHQTWVQLQRSRHSSAHPLMGDICL